MSSAGYEGEDISVPEIVTTRIFPVAPPALFRAFSDPAMLARWWGPVGFTNTITAYDFRSNGDWHVVMRGPDGTDCANDWRFLVVEPAVRLDLVHFGPMHRFWIRVSFAPEKGGTRLEWRMRFEHRSEHDKLRDFIATANEQSFDRLAAVLKP